MRPWPPMRHGQVLRHHAELSNWHFYRRCFGPSPPDRRPSPGKILRYLLGRLPVASGMRLEILGHVVERPHVGYYSISPEPPEWDGDGVYPPELIIEHLLTVAKG